MKMGQQSVVLLLLGLSTGCSTFKQVEKLNKQIATEQQQSEHHLQQLRQSLSRIRIHGAHETWVERKALSVFPERLPTALNQEVTVATETALMRNEFIHLMHKLCGIAIHFTTDAEIYLQKRREGTSRKTSNDQLINLHWQGKLEGLLDIVAASLGLSWRYCQHAVQFFYVDTRTFQLYTIPSVTEMSSTVHSGIDVGFGGEGTQSKGSGRSAQNTSVTLKSDMVQDIQCSLKEMLTPQVGRLSFSSSTGCVTVVDTPAVLQRIELFIEQQNRFITRQVLLNIKLLTVHLNDTNQLDLDWDGLYKFCQIKGPLLGAVGITKLTSGDGLSSRSFILEGGSGLKGSSKLFLNALAEQGKVSIVTSPSVTTLNLQSVPVQVATQRSYLAEIKTTHKEKGPNETTLVPGTVTYGFNMNLLPLVMADKQILLQYAINLNDLSDMKEFGIGGESKIQLPEISNRLFSQKVKLKSGETLILSGFEQTTQQLQHSGTGTAKNWLFGGRVGSKNNRQIIVLMITPMVLD